MGVSVIAWLKCVFDIGYFVTIDIFVWFDSLLFTWGSNPFGQLGYGEFDTNEPRPKLLKKLATKNIIQIACGDHHNLALTNGMWKFFRANFE